MNKNLHYRWYFKTVILAILFSSAALCQIPNAGFENWTNGNPDGWETTNNPQFTNIVQSTDAHSGSSAAKGTVAALSGFTIAPILSIQFPYSGKPTNFSGYYKFTSVSSDSLEIVIALYKNGVGIAGGVFHTTANANSYTQFNIPLTYISSETPDSVGIGFFIGPAAGTHSGSTFLIDDLSFAAGATAVNENPTLVPDRFELMQNYPNPFNPSTTISFYQPKSGVVNLEIFNDLGQTVSILFSGDLNAGKHEFNWNASNYPSGVYFYRISVQGDKQASPSFTAVRKMILEK